MCEDGLDGHIGLVAAPRFDKELCFLQHWKCRSHNRQECAVAVIYRYVAKHGSCAECSEGVYGVGKHQGPKEEMNGDCVNIDGDEREVLEGRQRSFDRLEFTIFCDGIQRES